MSDVTLNATADITPDAQDSPATKSKWKYTYFSTGPEQNLRPCRRYFWVPLNPRYAPPAQPDAQHDNQSNNLQANNAPFQNSYDAAIEQIIDWLKKPKQKETEFTDVFVVSHGWHRNLFGAAAAYDRLLSRFLLLLYTGRLPLQRDNRRRFNPLILGLHWHSDPGKDAGSMAAAGVIKPVSCAMPGRFLNLWREPALARISSCSLKCCPACHPPLMR